MDITQLTAFPEVQEAIASFKASCDAKTKFFDQLRGIISDVAPSFVENTKLRIEDFKLAVEKYNREHKFDSYQFRYNKKYTTSAVFSADDEYKVSAHDTLTFKGRNAKNPGMLVFQVAQQPEEGADAPQPWTVFIPEDIFKDWLKYEMVH